MAIEDISKKVNAATQEHAGKIQDALKSEQAEAISDKVLDGAAGLANKVTGGKFSDQVEDVRANLDKNIGNE